MFTDFYVVGYKKLNGEYLYFGVDDNGNKRWVTDIYHAVWFDVEQEAINFANSSPFIVKNYEITTVNSIECER